MLTRYRVQLMADRTREITRLELMLEDASVKLSSVASSVLTKNRIVSPGATLSLSQYPRIKSLDTLVLLTQRSVEPVSCKTLQKRRVDGLVLA